MLHTGLAALYNFEYSESLEAFDHAAAADPHCAMAEWGAAMTNWHELWNSSGQDDLNAGWKHVQAAQAREQFATPREKAYIAAVAAYFAPGLPPDEGDSGKRSAAYLAKMRELHASYPEDANATVFLALAILADNDRGTREERVARAREAGALLQPVFDADPAATGEARAGSAHYLIHAYDRPELAAQGLVAARAYAKIAPDSPHALHMPAHIFAQLGLWDEDVASNIASYNAARSQQGHAMEKVHEELHALDFLQYAYLELGDWTKAAETTATAVDIAREHGEGDMNYTLLWLPMREVIEHEDWQNWKSVPVAKGSDDGYWKAVTAWFDVMAAAHLHDAARADAALKTLRSLDANIRQNPKFGDGPALAVLLPEAEGWDAVAHGDYKTAIAKMKDAATEEAKPGSYGGFRKPAEEMLGDVYLAAGDKAAAHGAYEQSLRTRPNRRLSLLGLKATA
jgi:tetratricopeptide (TPR) repeat protein